MTPATPGQVCEEWFAAWSSHDVERLVALFSDECVWEDVPNRVHRGRAAVEALARSTYTMVPDLKLELLNVILGASDFVAEWQASGTNAGDTPDIPASGNRFRMRGASVVQLRDGRIYRYASYWDTRSMTERPLAE